MKLCRFSVVLWNEELRKCKVGIMLPFSYKNLKFNRLSRAVQVSSYKFFLLSSGININVCTVWLKSIYAFLNFLFSVHFFFCSAVFLSSGLHEVKNHHCWATIARYCLLSNYYLYDELFYQEASGEISCSVQKSGTGTEALVLCARPCAFSVHPECNFNYSAKRSYCSCKFTSSLRVCSFSHRRHPVST